VIVLEESYNDDIDNFSIRMIRSAISGWASTSQGNLVRMDNPGLRAPTARRAVRSPNFWLVRLTSVFFVSAGGRTVCLVLEGPDSRGAAIARAVILAPDIRA